jgi:hypothetical protein
MISGFFNARTCDGIRFSCTDDSNPPQISERTGTYQQCPEPYPLYAFIASHEWFVGSVAQAKLSFAECGSSIHTMSKSENICH